MELKIGIKPPCSATKFERLLHEDVQWPCGERVIQQSTCKYQYFCWSVRTASKQRTTSTQQASCFISSICYNRDVQINVLFWYINVTSKHCIKPVPQANNVLVVSHSHMPFALAKSQTTKHKSWWLTQIWSSAFPKQKTVSKANKKHHVHPKLDNHRQPRQTPWQTQD
jgi:hypothetical protein